VPPEISLQDVGLAVKRLQWRHHRGANSRLAAIGLSLPQWDVLRHLDANPDASLHRLAVLTFQTDQSMGALAARMIGRGLIERVEGPGRAVRHRLTPAGQDLRKRGSDLANGVLGESLGQLSEAELSILYTLLVKAMPEDGEI
jgi:DNA-binding MarR family transcriptional regulator